MVPRSAWARWSRVSSIRSRDDRDLPLDLLHARIRRPYARHMHAEYAIGTCTDGLESIYYRGAMRRAWPGTVVVIEAEEVHTGAPDAAVGDWFSYRVMYPHGQLFDGPAPHFPEPVIEDSGLAGRVEVIHRALAGPGGDRLEAECGLVEMLDQLVRRPLRDRCAVILTEPPAQRARPVRRWRSR
jgi:hypothetical protein